MLERGFVPLAEPTNDVRLHTGLLIRLRLYRVANLRGGGVKMYGIGSERGQNGCEHAQLALNVPLLGERDDRPFTSFPERSS